MNYKTIETKYTALFKEKSSKFFSLLFPVSTEEDVKLILTQVKKEYYDSRHVCYAYVLGNKKEIWRVNDAGEPSKTAGKPILGQITAFDLTNILVIVVRYFGGTKLGVGGLIQAYKTSAQMVLEKAIIIEKDVLIDYEINFSFKNLSPIMKNIKSVNGKIIINEQDELCLILCKIPMANENKFLSLVKLNYLSIYKK